MMTPIIPRFTSPASDSRASDPVVGHEPVAVVEVRAGLFSRT